MYDEHNLGYGALRKEIEEELLSRPIFIVVLSNSANRSPWVQRELDAALHLQDRQPSRVLLPVVAQTTDIPLLLVGYKYISGPHDIGLPPDEAAGRAASTLGLSLPAAGMKPLPSTAGTTPRTVVPSMATGASLPIALATNAAVAVRPTLARNSSGRPHD